MNLYNLKGVENKPYIKCIDIDGKYLGELPSKFFENNELIPIGIASNIYNIGNCELKKVFEDDKAFKEFSSNILNNINK
jgi:hypothetical protein